MLKDVVVPDIGDYQNVEIIEILVKVGDVIAVDDELLTLETDKAAMAIPSNLAGTVSELKVKIGDKVSRGSVLLSLAPNVANLPAAVSVEPKVAVSSSHAPSQIICVPDIGVSGSVAVIDVHVKVGQHIALEQALITLESDKAAMEIPSTHAGIIQELFVKTGDKIAMGAQILSITSSEPSMSPAVTAAAVKSPVSTPSPVITSRVAPPATNALPVVVNGLGHAGPGVRRFARELGVELTKVAGTARKGRIIRSDLTKYVKDTLQGGSSAHTSSNFNVAAMPEVNFADFGPIATTQLSRIKKLSGNFLHRNWVRIPHVTQFDEADITELENFRTAQKPLADKNGIKLTPVVFLMKAVVASLKAFPIFNSSLSKDGEQLIMKNYYHIGVAVDTPNGLVVPVVRNVDTKGLFELAQDLTALGDKARAGKLTALEMQGGCFSISSLGSIGGTGFTPIVNAPEVAILGVSKAKMQPVYRENVFVPRLILPLSLSYDHRVIDGADAARFCAFIADQLSDIRRLLL